MPGSDFDGYTHHSAGDGGFVPDDDHRSMADRNRRDFLPFVGSFQASNITNVGESAIAGYSFERAPNQLLYTPSTVSKLQAWDISTNGSVLIGKSVNTVYSLDPSSDTTRTYYPIGGDGGPNIMIDLFQNYDPAAYENTIEHSKCSDYITRGAYSGKFKGFELNTRDGKSYCFPLWVAAFNKAVRYVFEEQSTEFQDEFRGESDVVQQNWPRRLYVRWYMDNDSDSTHAEALLREQHAGVHFDDTEYAWTEDTARNDYIGKNAGLITGRRATQRLNNAMDWSPGGSSPGSTYLIKVYVPWESSQISELSTNWSAINMVAREYAGLDNIGYPDDLGMREIGGLDYYSLENYKDRANADWEDGRPMKINYYNTVYSTLEAEGLISKFGARGSVGDNLNSLFMPMANFLVSTFIESVYTFKTIKMPPLTTETITPNSLSAHQGSVTVSAYETTATPYTPTSYYPTSYGARETFTDPTYVSFESLEEVIDDLRSGMPGFSMDDPFGAGSSDAFFESEMGDTGLPTYEGTTGEGVYESSVGSMTGGGSGGTTSGGGGGGSY